MSRTRQTAADGLLAAVLFALQISLIHLPNIELVSVMVIVYTLVLGKRVLNILAVFTILEGMFHGFGIWWISYLYLWPALAAITWLCRKIQSSLGWAILAAAYGLSFGALCAIPYLLTGGWTAGLSYWVSGIPFDLAHCGGNFVATLALYRPLRRALTRLQTALLT